MTAMDVTPEPIANPRSTIRNSQFATAPSSPIHMIRAELDVRSFHRWAGSRGLISRGAFDEGFAMHCLLVESFGDLAPKPFRVIIPRDTRRRVGVLYGYSRSTADELRETAAVCADPCQAKILPAARIDGKPMPDVWRPGKRLGFEVLIRPIVRRKRYPPKRGHSEHDAFQIEADPDLVGRHKGNKMLRTREQVYGDWLGERLQRNGARLECAALKSFQRVRAIRKLRARATEGPRALMQGTLTIADADAFAGLLARGLGRHKAYGYGMLLLRPPHRKLGSND